MFYNLNDLWTEQLAELATSLLNQFNTSSDLFFRVSAIRLFHLQQRELAPTSPLSCWTPIQEFYQYKYNNIAANLFLLKHSDTQLSFRCNSFLTNNIQGGIQALINTMPLEFIQ